MNKIIYCAALFLILLVSSPFDGRGNDQKFSKAIEDNSFLIEEAYNQEPGVIQHISVGEYFSKGNDFMYTFTQEMPVTGLKHQFSYDIPYSFVGNRNGIGDISINYRYQLYYTEAWACVSPRISFILPTGNNEKGFGSGAYGTQINIPVSKRISESFAAHFNIGTTYLDQAEFINTESGETIKKSIMDFHVGGSIIWLASQNLNFMLEWRTDFMEQQNASGGFGNLTETIINPGIRYAIDIDDLQIVPGLSIPVVLGDEVSTYAFFYLSFEHPLSFL